MTHGFIEPTRFAANVPLHCWQQPGSGTPQTTLTPRQSSPKRLAGKFTAGRSKMRKFAGRDGAIDISASLMAPNMYPVHRIYGDSQQLDLTGAEHQTLKNRSRSFFLPLSEPLSFGRRAARPSQAPLNLDLFGGRGKIFAAVILQSSVWRQWTIACTVIGLVLHYGNRTPFNRLDQTKAPQPDRMVFVRFITWCPEPDSNRHGPFRVLGILSPVRLPISPSGHK
jgi:hypothetical protein